MYPNFFTLSNQKFSWEHSRIKVGRPAIYSLSWAHMAAYVAFIEGNSPQCGPQYICGPHCGSSVGQSHFYSPNNVGTSHAFAKSFPSIYPGNNKGFSIENHLLRSYLPTHLLYYLPTLIPYYPICLFYK